MESFCSVKSRTLTRCWDSQLKGASRFRVIVYGWRWGMGTILCYYSTTLYCYIYAQNYATLPYHWIEHSTCVQQMFQSTDVGEKVVVVQSHQRATKPLQHFWWCILAVKCFKITKSASCRQLLVQRTYIKIVARCEDCFILLVWEKFHVKGICNLLAEPWFSHSDVAIDENNLRVVIKPFPSVVEKLPERIVRSRFIWPWLVLSFGRLSVCRCQVRNLRLAWNTKRGYTTRMHEQKLSCMWLNTANSSADSQSHL